jgi:hypothetical protein
VGWPVITFLMAERLRNLGKFTFADVAGYRFQQTPIRAFAASGTLVVVAFYLIAQMVGAGQLIKLLFGLEYWMAVVIVGALMMVYVLFGGMTATTWVQIIKAVLLLAGASFMAFMVLVKFGFSPEAMFAKAVEIKTALAAKDAKLIADAATAAAASGKDVAEVTAAMAAEGRLHHGPGLLREGSDLRHLLRHGADVRYRWPAAHPDALLHRAGCQGSSQVRGLGHRLDRLLLHPDLHHRLRRHLLRADRPDLPGCQGRPEGRRQHGGYPPGQRSGRQRLPRLHLRGCLRHHSGRGCRSDPVRCVRRVPRLVRHGVQEWQCRFRPSCVSPVSPPSCWA